MLAIDVINLLAAEGAYSASVTEQLERSEVWQAYSRQKHDLFLPAAGNAQVGCHCALPPAVEEAASIGCSAHG